MIFVSRRRPRRRNRAYAHDASPCLPPRSVAVVAIALLACTTARGARAANAVRHSERLAVDGAQLFLEVRGDDRGAPILLWLHGGPGGPERPLFRWFDGDLEHDCVVAYWDQRGAGRSFDPAADPHRLTIARHLADLDAVVARVRTIVGRDRVVLLGHSWGAMLAVLYAQAHPGEVAAVVAVNPLVSAARAQRAQWEFVTAEATRRRDDDVLRRLAALGPPPHTQLAALLEVEHLADRYGAVFHRPPPRLRTVLGGVLYGLVTPWELPRFFHGNDVSLAAMTPELLGHDLARDVPELAVPVAVFVGRYDRHVGAEIAEQWLAELRAPVKRLVTFEESAHNVPFEEPERFVEEVRSALRSFRERVAAGATARAQKRSMSNGPAPGGSGGRAVSVASGSPAW